MPASLSNQIRLGFSLGWRIWTPNEVGFYAKTLAHSYFIFTILRAKFLTKKMWIVNYSIFMASLKYLVFIEFIEFGIKTKEERTYWKKIMYISLLIRHKKFKSKQKYTPSFEKMKTLSRFFRRLSQPMREPAMKAKLWKFFRQEVAPAGYRQHCRKSAHGSSFERLTTLLNTGYGKYSISKLGLQFKADWEPVLENTKLFRKAVKRHLTYSLAKAKVAKISKFKWFFSGKINKRKKKTIKRKKIERKRFKFPKQNAIQVMATNLMPTPVTRGTISQVLGRYTARVEKNKKITAKPVTLGRYRKDFAQLERLENIRATRHTKSILEDLTEVQRRMALNNRDAYVEKRQVSLFSITGGPRKRLFRNIKRSFQGKFIVHYASLVWFWEKVSRLVTYIIRRLTKGNRPLRNF